MSETKSSTVAIGDGNIVTKSAYIHVGGGFMLGLLDFRDGETRLTVSEGAWRTHIPLTTESAGNLQALLAAWLLERALREAPATEAEWAAENGAVSL